MTEKCLLITGGAGFIGSHAIVQFAQEAANLQCRIVAIDNFEASDENCFRGFLLHYPSVIYYRMDVRDKHQLERIFMRHDFHYILHFAGRANVQESVENPVLYYDNIVSSISCLLGALIERQYTHSVTFIQSSTCAVYGAPENSTQVDEDSPIQPISAYGRAKRMAEQILLDAVISHPGRLCVGVLRYFNVIGADDVDGWTGEQPILLAPRRYRRLMTACCESARTGEDLVIYGSGEQKRDYIHVCDLVAAHLGCLRLVHERTHDPFIVFVVGSGQAVSTNEFVAAFEEVSGTKISRNYLQERRGHATSICANNKKARKLLGWKPTRTLHDAIRNQIDWVHGEYGNKGE